MIILNFEEFLLENDNPKYPGDFITQYNGWCIDYSDRPNHYITDRLMERNKSVSTDPVKEINGLMIKLVKHLNCNKFNLTDLKLALKFKNKKYLVIVEVSVSKKSIYLCTIKSLDMNVRKDTIKINL